MATEFVLPELGEGVESAEVARLFVHEGDTIASGDNVAELTTDKAVADLPCPHAGKVTKLHVSEGDTVEIGQPVLTLEPAESKAEAEEKPAAPEEEPEPTPPREEPAAEEKEEAAPAEGEEEAPSPEAAEPARAEGDGRGGLATRPRRREAPPGQLPPPAGPATRRLARKLGVDLREVWSGRAEDRVSLEDVAQKYAARAPAPSALPPLPDFGRFGPVERRPLGHIYKKGAELLGASWPAIPQVTQHDLADISELEEARRQYLKTLGPDAPKITLMPFAIKAVVATLKEFPRFNSSLDRAAGELIVKQHYHISIAVDTDEGLVAPVLRDADRKSVRQLAEELAELADKARGGKLSVEEMRGGTFTISNQGGIGGTSFTPLVTHPQVAILGLSRAHRRPEMTDGGELESRLMLPLSLSYDHRVVNGADAARFAGRLAQLLSNPFGLLVEG
jgi:pyruvate dehydrogenase E2 component (dihydrolipoamide acetyltransferase)